MYALYSKVAAGDSVTYEFKEPASLFGRVSGFIPWLLHKTLDDTISEPYRWTLNLGDALAENGYPSSALIINLKPRNKGGALSLYEVASVWGYSAHGWTPMMLQLDGLFIDAASEQRINDRFFVKKRSQKEGPIFSFLYLSGAVKAGELEGKWTPPSSSPTHSALLFPETMRFFMDEARRVLDIDR